MSSLLGMTLGNRYRLEERIGAGGMSTVYRAMDETLQRHVAVKVMNQEVASDSDQLERFRREARSVAKLSHAHVVSVIDAGEDDGRPYIVFEYVEGETLKERIRRQDGLPIPEAVAYAIEIARALGAAHTRQIVHRDVKPQNVLIDSEGTAKVTDFGIARTLDEDGLTADGRVIGTTDYVSPEQALGQPVTGQSDIYSLGIVLYEMLAGEVPFKGENQVAVAMKHVHDPLPDVRIRRPEASAALASVVDTATAKDPARRYADDSALIADLEDALAIETARSGQATGEATAVLNTIPLQKRRRVPISIRHRTRVVVAGAIVLVLAACVGIWLSSRTRSGADAGKRTPSHSITKPIALKLCAGCAVAYNPDGYAGVTTQNNQLAPQAIDGKSSTAWMTENYYSGQLGKPGVGLYLRAGSPVDATALTILTSTPGFQAKIYGSVRTPDASSFAASGWQLLASIGSVAHDQRISLNTKLGRHTYFLIWITRLPPGQQDAALNELQLYN